ncbi:uncharacterized protein LOC134286883 [Aedes albopictus]|uniref:Retroviral polymerase SH3-like domain-containing protein n=1 Tax=Aedes albopictus TaxID=7160 RepID=A0ABM1Z767_AEDAL
MQCIKSAGVGSSRLVPSLETNLLSEKRRKLDKKAEKLVFVSYAEGQKAYRFENLKSKGVDISRDPKFDEKRGVEEEVNADLDSDAGGDDLNATLYDSADDDLADEPSFHGFPLDEVARRSGRVNKGKRPVRLIEEAYAAGTVSKAVEPRNLKETVSCEAAPNGEQQW